ncbi:MAG: Ig-like domain-containing protein [Lachnospiraceae bacterium]|nr:Ig-like domain-containing protein [Lachnospiraceae bacterium]
MTKANKTNITNSRQKTYRAVLTALALFLTLTLAFPLTTEAAGKLNKKSLSLAKGTSYTLKIKGVKKSKIKWSSSNQKVAKVNKNGKVTAKKKGTATITAKTAGKTYRCKVTVNNAKLNRKSASLLVGNSYTFKVKGTSKKVKWTSSNTKVATVKNGKVTAKKKGRATITAKVGDSSLKATVRVYKGSSSDGDYDNDNNDNDNNDKDDDNTKPALNAENITVKVGESYQLSVSGTASTVSWYGHDTSVATVVNGKVTGITPGSTGVYAKVDNQMLYCHISVIQNVEADIKAAKAEMAVLIAEADKINNDNHQYGSASYQAFKDNLASAKAAYQGNDLETLKFWLSWLRDYEISPAVPQQLTYYPTVSKQIFDDINEYRESLGIEPLIWGENCSKRARVQAGYNCLNVNPDLLSNENELSKLAHHGSLMCGYGISGIGSYHTDAERKAAVSTYPKILNTANVWANSPTHKLLLQRTYSAEGTKPYGAVAVYTYNTDSGATFVSVVYATYGFDKVLLQGDTDSYGGITMHNWNNLSEDLTPQILNCAVIY